MTRHPTNHQPRCPLLLALILPATLVAGAGAPGAVAQHVAVESKVDNLADLERLFRDPPADARIMMRWWWFGPAVTTGELEREMRAMRDAGIGGFEVQPVYPVALDAASGQVRTLPFLSDGFIEALRFASAKSRELGLRMDLTLGSGWPYGGPQVTIDGAAGRLRVERVKVPEGAGRVMVPDIGAGERLIAAFLVDSAGPREVTDIADGVLRLPPASTAAREALFFIGSRTGQMVKRAAVNAEGFVVDHYDRAAIDHYLADVGDPLLRAFGENPPYAIFCDSLEVYESDWTSGFLDEFRRRRGYDLLPYLPAITGRVVGTLELSERFLWDLRLTAQELIIENHATHLKELGRRDGFGLSIEPYDMTPCADMTLGTVADVPQGEFWLCGFNTAHSVIEAASVGHTCGRRIVGAEAFTSSDEERWQANPAAMKALGDWALAAGVNRIVFHRYQHQARLDLRPGMTMGPYGVHWERTQTFWDMLPACHRYLTRCQFMLRQGLPVADVCYLVAEGAPQVFRAPESALRGSPPDRLGWNFDACAPETLVASMSVRDGRLVLPDGMSYRLLVLPERETMTPGLLRKVRDLAAAGATVVGPPPRKSPGLAGYPECDAEVRALAAELWGDGDGVRVTEHAIGKGRVIWVREAEGAKEGKAVARGPKAGAGLGNPGDGRETEATAAEATLAKGRERLEDSTWHVGAAPLSEPRQYGDFAVAARVLSEMSIPPDFESDGAVRYAHRRDGDTDIYFVANAAASPLEATCVFRVTGKRPELWDAVTGEVRDLTEWTGSNGRTSAPLSFAPHQSFFVVFRKAAADAPAGEKAGGNTGGALNFTPLVEAGKVDGPWDVSFDPRWGGPEKVVFEGLDDWSRRPEEGIKYYSGHATYEKVFDLPEAVGSMASSRLWLDLGAVKDIARVRLNGRDLGVVWCDPWRVEITGAVKARRNRLEVTVANLWPNRLIGDERQPADCEYGRDGSLSRWPEWLLKGEPRPSPGRYTFSTWKHFEKDSPLLPSGLLGPVTFVTEGRAR